MPSNPRATHVTCASATTDAPRRPIIILTWPQWMRPSRGAISATSAVRVRRPAYAAIGITRLRLSHHFRRGHGLALPRRELAPRLFDGGHHTLSPALSEPTAQDGDQFRLVVGIELFGGVECIGKCELLTHCDLPTQGDSARVLDTKSAVNRVASRQPHPLPNPPLHANHQQPPRLPEVLVGRHLAASSAGFQFLDEFAGFVGGVGGGAPQVQRVMSKIPPWQ